MSSKSKFYKATARDFLRSITDFIESKGLKSWTMVEPVCSNEIVFSVEIPAEIIITEDGEPEPERLYASFNFSTFETSIQNQNGCSIDL